MYGTAVSAAIDSPMRFGLSAVIGRHRVTLISVLRFRALHVVLYRRVFQCAVLAGTGSDSVVIP